MSKKYEVIISDKAWAMLIQHARFLANVNETAANRLIESFQNAANSLTENPERCPFFTNPEMPPNRYRWLLFEKRYLLVFLVSDCVYVDNVVDTRQNYMWLIN